MFFVAAFTAQRISVMSLWVAIPKSAFPASLTMSTRGLHTSSGSLKWSRRTTRHSSTRLGAQAKESLKPSLPDLLVLSSRTGTNSLYPPAHFLYPRLHGYRWWWVNDDNGSPYWLNDPWGAIPCDVDPIVCEEICWADCAQTDRNQGDTRHLLFASFSLSLSLVLFWAILFSTSRWLRRTLGGMMSLSSESVLHLFSGAESLTSVCSAGWAAGNCAGGAGAGTFISRRAVRVVRGLTSDHSRSGSTSLTLSRFMTLRFPVLMLITVSTGPRTRVAEYWWSHRASRGALSWATNTTWSPGSIIFLEALCCKRCKLYLRLSSVDLAASLNARASSSILSPIALGSSPSVRFKSLVRGALGLLPYCRKNGVNPVTDDVEILWAQRACPRQSSNWDALWFTSLRIISFDGNVQCGHSFGDDRG